MRGLYKIPVWPDLYFLSQFQYCQVFVDVGVII